MSKDKKIESPEGASFLGKAKQYSQELKKQEQINAAKAAEVMKGVKQEAFELYVKIEHVFKEFDNQGLKGGQILKFDRLAGSNKCSLKERNVPLFEVEVRALAGKLGMPEIVIFYKGLQGITGRFDVNEDFSLEKFIDEFLKEIAHKL